MDKYLVTNSEFKLCRPTGYTTLERVPGSSLHQRPNFVAIIRSAIQSGSANSNLDFQVNTAESIIGANFLALADMTASLLSTDENPEGLIRYAF